MKNRLYTSFLISMILMLALSACAALASPVPATETPKPTAAPTTPPLPTKPPAPVVTDTPAVPEGAVTSLDDVKSATIQIESQGTFIDPQVGMVVNGAGRGSGFIIDPSGLAITNNHVVTGAALLKVWVGGNKDKVYNARVIGASECSDLAVIKIDGASFPFLQWHTATPKVGLEVYAAGYPLGDPEFTLTKGIISKAQTNGNTDWASVSSVLEHDARINPGNSGGPLVDKDGKVVGINYASNNANQYFAIAKAEADVVLKDLEAGTDVNSIGVNGQVVMTEDKSLSGVWVASVKSGSPADKSGLKPGDIIVQLEGLVIGTDGTKADYCQILRSHKATDTLTMNVLRWPTQEILEGQLNGRALSVTGTYSGGQGSSGGTKETPTSGTVTVYDDSSVISMEVPSDWEYNGGAWKSTWNIGNNSFDFTAQTLTVSPDVNAYDSGWDMKGVFIATSADWGSIGGYANLLEGVRSFYTDCTPATAKNYKDATFEGQAIVYTKCGPNRTNALVLALRPIKNPTAYLVLMELKYANDTELNELDAIISTANVNP